MTICVCLLLGVPEIYTKSELCGLTFFFLNILVKVLKCYICQFDEIFIVNTEQLVMHECNIHVRLTRSATYKRSKQYVFEKNIGMFMPHLDQLRGI